MALARRREAVAGIGHLRAHAHRSPMAKAWPREVPGQIVPVSCMMAMTFPSESWKEAMDSS
jgi:hypothetical protein